MVVPVPRRRQDDISPLHVDALAVDSGETALSFDNEAHGERRVSVCSGCLIRHHEL